MARARLCRLLFLPVLLAAVLAILPTWMQLVGSVTPGSDLLRGTLPLWFGRLTAMPYIEFLDLGGLRWLLNSAVVSTLAVVGQVFVSVLAAYAFAWKRFPGRDVLFWLFVASMALPVQALLIPRVVLVRKLGLYGLPGLLLAYWVATGNIFLLRQFCRSLAAECLDAARIDGASEWTLITRLALPMMKPAIVFVAVGQFIGAWGDLFWPSLMLRGDAVTLPVGIYWLSSQGIGTYGDRMTRLMAGGVVSLVPILALFLAFQEQLAQGYMEEWA